MTKQDTNKRRSVAILGVRGIPAAHGGFETFAARLAPFLVAAGWDVSVYCQEESIDPAMATHIGGDVWQSTWEGVRRLHIAVGKDTPLNSVVFDWDCVSHAVKDRPDVVLILGYNTAVFATRLRLAGIPTVINMDGIEWQRSKWSAAARLWLYVNDWAGCLAANHLVADHPRIERHLTSRVAPKKITVIPYGCDVLEPDPDDRARLELFGLTPGDYATVIARPEPENSLLEIVEAFSAKRRGIKLVVLGNYRAENAYHAAVKAAASTEVVFAGAIYLKQFVDALRRHALLYVHGHQVGGCNPSLLEAMGAGNPILAHHNQFNRWVVRDGAEYFSTTDECARAFDRLLADRARLARLSTNNRNRAHDVFGWEDILQSYAEMLTTVSTHKQHLDTGAGWGRRPEWQLDTETS